MDNRFLQAALVYEKRGWCVIPCKPGTKVPAVDWKKYQKKRSTKKQIEGWWTKWPDANVAIVTGEVSGITLIDIDGSKGIESLTTLPEPLPDTRRHTTPHGAHYLYQYQPLLYTGANFLPGIDVRNDGGIAVMPPSVVDSTEYKVEANSDVFASFDLPPEVLYKRSEPTNDSQPTERTSDYLGWLGECWQNGVGEGERNDVAHHLASLFRSRNFPSNFISSLLATYGDRCNPPMDTQEIKQTINSAQRYAITLTPELSSDHYKIDVGKIDIPQENRGEIITYTETIGEHITLVFRASNIRKERTGVHARVEMSFNGLTLAWTNGNIERDEDRVRLCNSAYSKLSDEMQTQVDKRVMKQWLDEFSAALWDIYVGQLTAIEHVTTEIVEQEFLLRPYLMPEAGTIIFAPPGMGKSWTGLAMAISVDAGHSGIWQIERPQRVLFLNLERSEYSVGRRIAQINKALGLHADRPLLTINARGRTLEDVHEAVVRDIDKHDIALILVDSISRAGTSGSLTENTFANHIMDLLNKTGKGWLSLAHSPRADASHVYGSQMFDAAADVLIQLTSDEVSVSGRLGIGLKVTKANDIAKPPMEMLSLNFDDYGLCEFRRARSNEFVQLEVSAKVAEHQQIVDFLKYGAADINEIAEYTGIHKRTVTRNLAKATDLFVVTEKTFGRNGAKFGLKARLSDDTDGQTHVN